MPDRHLDALDYKKIYPDREKRLRAINKFRFIPTVPYLKFVFFIKTGRHLNLKNPKLFAEKLNWLKIHDVHPEYTNYADKAYMKEFISEKYGPEYVIPCLGIWKKWDDIDFDLLPNQFVLKCTHDSGSVKIIKDKSSIDKIELKKFFENRLSINAYNLGREYPYKDIKPQIIAEKYISESDGSNITDLKIMCFNGNVQAFYFISGKGTGQSEALTWFDKDCNRLDIIDKTGDSVNENIIFPKNLNRIFEMAEELSQGIKFVRVDFFVKDEAFYFSEMTFYNNGGFVLLEPIEWEEKFGDMLQLQSEKK